MAAGLAVPAVAQEPRPQPPRGGGLMAALDRNGNGKLEADEIDLAVVSLRRLDKNGDGEVGPEELRGGERGPGRPPGGPGPDGRRGRPAFDQLDKDGDGKLSREEAPERMRERFDQMDTNGDGFFDKEEQDAFIELIRERVQRGGRVPPGEPRRPGERPDPSEGEGESEKPKRPEPKDQ